MSLDGLFGAESDISHVGELVSVSKGETESGRERWDIEFMSDPGTRCIAFVYWPEAGFKDYFSRANQEIQRDIDEGDRVFFIKTNSDREVLFYLKRHGKEDFKMTFKGSLKYYPIY